MKKIIFTRPDGGVSIINPTGSLPIEAVFAKDVPNDAINPQIVDESEIPIDTQNRNEWVIKNGKISVDAVKVQLKTDLNNQKQSEKDAILSKLKISKQELDKLVN